MRKKGYPETSHGPVDGGRYAKLSRFVYFQVDIAWETKVCVADAPSHLIHFNRERFLGPYA